MIVLVGPSASGKTEIANALIRMHHMQRIVTCTTRKKREGEVDHVHYHFYSKELFLKKIEEQAFLEFTSYNEEYYGTLKEEVSNEKIWVVDPNGVNAACEVIPKDITVFFLEAPVGERIRRMIARGDTFEKIDARLLYDVAAFQKHNIKRIDHLIHNYEVTIEESATKIHQLYRLKQTLEK